MVLYMVDKKIFNIFFNYMWEDFRLGPQSGIILLENGVKS